jgi:hypothetical protein
MSAHRQKNSPSPSECGYYGILCVGKSSTLLTAPHSDISVEVRVNCESPHRRCERHALPETNANLEFGQRRIVGRFKGVKPARITLYRPVPPHELIVHENAHFRRRCSSIILEVRGSVCAPHQSAPSGMHSFAAIVMDTMRLRWASLNRSLSGSMDPVRITDLSRFSCQYIYIYTDKMYTELQRGH